MCKIAVTILTIISLSRTFVTFEKRYGGDNDDVGCCVTQTTDGGYALAGSTRSFGAGALDFYFIKTDSLGDTLWTRTYGGIYTDSCFAMIQCSDGGYVLVGQTRSYGTGGAGDVYIIKIDSLGDSLWAKTYGGTGHDTGKDVVETRDGGFLVGGTNCSVGANGEMYLLRLTPHGDTTWTRTYGGGNLEQGAAVCETFDRCCLMAGHSRSFSPGGDDYNIYLVKTDTLGNTIWEKTFGNWGDNRCSSVIQSADSGFFIAGQNAYLDGYFYNYFTAISKTTSTGDSLWTHQISGEMGYDVKQTVDGGYIVTGFFIDSAEVHAHLIKTDSLGNTIWTQDQTNDGGYVVAGYTKLHPLTIDERDFYLLKTDTNGTLYIAESHQTDLDRDKMLFASPNPFRHFTQLIGMKLDSEIVSIYDVTGSLVHIATGVTIGQNLKPGVYFLICRNCLPTKIVKLE
jgi:hypothetical protein